MPYSFGILLGVLFVCTGGNYEIKLKKTSKETVSFLDAGFNSVSEAIFPAKLSVSLNMGVIRGLLLYSIDHNKNQLVLKLKDDVGSILSLRFRDLNPDINLVTLCGCQRNCWFEMLNITIRIGVDIGIQCNGLKGITFKYSNETHLDTNYPLIMFPLPSNGDNAAHLWMVNHPTIGSAYVDWRNLVGCIYAVEYRDRDVTLRTTGPGSKVGCSDACATTGVCHSGRCIGTLNDDAVCDCTKSPRSGTFCNDDFNGNSTKIYNFQNQIDFLKLVWEHNINSQIMLLEISNNTISLHQNENVLMLKCNCKRNESNNFRQEIVLDNNLLENDHIIIFHFNTNVVTLLMLRDGQKITKVHLSENYGPKSRMKLTIYSGKADAVYKARKEILKWRTVGWKILQSKNKIKPNYQSPEKFKPEYKIVITVITLMLFLAIAVYFIITYKRLIHRKLCENSTDDEIENMLTIRDTLLQNLVKEYKFLISIFLSNLLNRFPKNSKTKKKVLKSSDSITKLINKIIDNETFDCVTNIRTFIYKLNKDEDYVTNLGYLTYHVLFLICELSKVNRSEIVEPT